MTLHTYEKINTGQSMPNFFKETPFGRSTSIYWNPDGGEIELSKSRNATFDEIDDFAESQGLTAWGNYH